MNTWPKNGAGVIRVLLASTSAVRRAGLEVLLGRSQGVKLVGSVQGLKTIEQRARDAEADVVVIDLDTDAELPQGTTAPTVVLTDDAPVGWSAAAVRAGARAILARDSGVEEISAAIHAAYGGFVLLEPEAALEMARAVRSAPVRESGEELTARELEVLRLMGEGYLNREMAARMGISEHTVKFHVSSILNKLGAETRTEAVSLGIRMGMIVV